MMSGKELSMHDDEKVTSTPMLDFYRDKKVFVTGGTGFIGKLVVAKLLGYVIFLILNLALS